MSLIDFIAFIAAMLFLLVSHIAQSRAKKKNGEIQQENQDEIFEEFESQELRDAKKLQELILQRKNNTQELKKWTPQPRPQAQSLQQQKAQLQKPANFSHKSQEIDLFQAFNTHQKAYEAYEMKTTQFSRGSEVLKKLNSSKEMMIITEILSKPKGF